MAKRSGTKRTARAGGGRATGGKTTGRPTSRRGDATKMPESGPSKQRKGSAGAGQATGPGSCAPLPHLGEICDGPCAEVNAICSDGTCIPGGLAGAPCDDAFDCSHYYSCEASKCGAYPSLGASCTNRCADGAFCEAGTCVAQKATGAPCLYNDECTSHLCERELCYEPTVCI